MKSDDVQGSTTRIYESIVKGITTTRGRHSGVLQRVDQGNAEHSVSMLDVRTSEVVGSLKRRISSDSLAIFLTTQGLRSATCGIVPKRVRTSRATRSVSVPTTERQKMTCVELFGLNERKGPSSSTTSASLVPAWQPRGSIYLLESSGTEVKNPETINYRTFQASKREVSSVSASSVLLRRLGVCLRKIQAHQAQDRGL